MTTVINNPGNGTSDNGSGGAGMIIAVVVVIAIIALFFLYGLPALRNSAGNGSNTGTTVNVPDKIQVNVNKP